MQFVYITKFCKKREVITRKNGGDDDDKLLSFLSLFDEEP
jgi:hypothetical protein